MAATPAVQTATVSRSESGAVTPRAIVLGLVMALGVNLWISISEYAYQASRMQLSHFPFALFAAYLTVVLLNGVIRRFFPHRAFTEAELLTLLAMGFVSTAIPTSGITGFLMGILGSAYYFATPENQWATYLHPYLPGWAIPSNEQHAMTWFYESLPEGQAIPYSAWIGPVLWWLSFLLALAVVLFCTAVILRRPWVNNQRLLYPLASVGATLAQTSPGRMLPGALRGGLFWAGFGLGFGIIAWNILNYFWPVVPTIQLRGKWIYIVRGFPRVYTGINLFTIGFAYFANLNILFSTWFLFIAVFWIPNGILNRIGYAITPVPPNINSADTEVAAWQGFGALTVLVCWMLWNARAHIREVFAAAFGRADDGDELLSYRAAVFGLIGSLVFICAFFARLGMQGMVIALFVPVLCVNYLSIARIVAETGLVHMRTTLADQYAVTYTLGSRSLSPSSMAGLSLTYSLVSQGKGVLMTPFVHVVKIADFIRQHRRRLVPALFLVLAIGILADVLFTVMLGYRIGAFNFNAWPFSSAGPRAYDVAASHMRSPYGPSWERITVFGIGAALMVLLTFLHRRFPRWPIHPIGFPIAPSWTTQVIFFSILIVWGAKAILLKVGGVLLYRRWQPFFLGILVGYALAVILSFVVDVVWFPGQGHRAHTW